MKRFITYSFLIVSCSISLFVRADTVKYVYAFNPAGHSIVPLNAETDCPDPRTKQIESGPCKGVKLNGDGGYSFQLNDDDIAENNLLLVVQEYRVIDNGYSFLLDRSRLETITKGTANTGANINKLTDLLVRTVEEQKGRKLEFYDNEATNILADIDINRLNQSMGVGRRGNNDNYESQAFEDAINKKTFSEKEEDILIALSKQSFLDHKTDNLSETYGKNLIQGFINDTLIEDIDSRIRDKRDEIKAAGGSVPVMLLEADRYAINMDESVTLTTRDSIHATFISGYTWSGVTSSTTSATFTGSAPGKHEVCVAGQVGASNNYTEDCVVITVRDTVSAKAIASSYEIYIGDSVALNASASSGATSYEWSGAGSFDQANSSVTQWTAPNTAGAYQLRLAINGSIYDVVSINVLDNRPISVIDTAATTIYVDGTGSTCELVSFSLMSNGDPVDSINWSVVDMPSEAVPALSSITPALSTFSADKPGFYTIALTANGLSSTDTSEVTIHIIDHVKPVAQISSDSIISTQQKILIDGGLSSHPEDAALTYSWEATGGTLTNNTSVAASFESNIAGSFDITLTVSDGQNTASATQIIYVRDKIERLTILSDGTEPNGSSFRPKISGDGRYVAFESNASNLVPGDTNGMSDIFLKDTVLNTITRVSVDSSGAQAEQSSLSADISENGQFILFSSQAKNLDTSVLNFWPDIYVHDRISGSTENISVSSDGAPSWGVSENGARISASGRYVSFSSRGRLLVEGDTNEQSDIFIRDRLLKTTKRVSVSSMGAQSNKASYYSVISGNGRFVVFSSNANNLDTLDTDSGGTTDVFLHDTLYGTTRLISKNNQGIKGEENRSSHVEDVSDDGRYITYTSYASNLAPGDTNGASDIFVYDKELEMVTRVSLDSGGNEAQANSNIGGSHAHNSSFSSTISSNGRYVVFTSFAENLVAGDNNKVSDLFVKDRVTGETRRLSVNKEGVEGNSHTGWYGIGVLSADISSNGKYVVFVSGASNLVPNDTNGVSDIFIVRTGF